MALILSRKNIENIVLSGNIDDYPEGIILPVDKPYRWTSADVIRKVKFNACRHFHKKNLKVGHAGTLDPLATGVLLVCIGKATKLAEELQRHEKEYEAGITFGATTPSYDLEKDIDARYSIENVSEKSLAEALEKFIGAQEQVAPLFSAKSVDGVRAYELARKEWKRMKAGNVLEQNAFDHSAVETLSKQVITISGIELLRYSQDGIPEDGSELLGAMHAEDNARNCRINVTDNSALHLPHAEIRVRCSKGTYIRALARDIGESLDSGAHLDALRRTRTGDFSADEALTIEQAIGLLQA